MGNGAQAMPNQINIMERGNDGEGEYGAQTGEPRDRDPAAVIDGEQKNKKHRGQLRESIGFAEDAGPKIAQSGDGVKHCAGGKNRNVATENQNCKFPWDFMQDGKHQEHGAEQQFVGNGIEILTEYGLLLEGPGQQTVQAIAESCEYEQNESRTIVPFHEFDHNEGQEHHAQQR